VIARETARMIPQVVSRVITYGTPAIGGPTYTLGARAFGHAESDRIRRVVSWPACIDRTSPDVEHVEVRSTHAGMGLDPNVWQIVATRLATPN
jgi:hypothetical protein